MDPMNESALRLPLPDEQSDAWEPRMAPNVKERQGEADAAVDGSYQEVQ